MEMDEDEDDLIRRAYAAYFRSSGPGAHLTIKPNALESRVEEVNGKRYVVLSSGGILEVYRVTNQGQLRRLRRWPREIKEED